MANKSKVFHWKIAGAQNRNWLYLFLGIDNILSIKYRWEHLMWCYQINYNDNIKSILRGRFKQNKNSVKLTLSMSVWPNVYQCVVRLVTSGDSPLNQFILYLIQPRVKKLLSHNTHLNTISQIQTRWNVRKTKWKRNEKKHQLYFDSDLP